MLPVRSRRDKHKQSTGCHGESTLSFSGRYYSMLGVDYVLGVRYSGGTSAVTEEPLIINSDTVAVADFSSFKA